MIESPQQLLEKLSAFYSDLESEVMENEIDYGYIPELTYHQIWLQFAPKAKSQLSSMNEEKLVEFCNIINYMVKESGEKENSVSTCFLEHATQIGVYKLIKPHLSKEAKYELL